MNRQAHHSRFCGFSLLELMLVIAILVAVLTTTTPAVNSILKCAGFAHELNQLSDFLQQARSAAVSGNTYVWVGILPVPAGSDRNKNGTSKILLAAVVGKYGQSSDLADGNYLPLSKGRILKNVSQQQFSMQILYNSSRATVGVDDLSTSQLDTNASLCQFSQPVGQEGINNQPPRFTQLIRFGPLGNARIKTTASRWIEIGMQSTESKQANMGILQINGLTGQVRVFRP